MLCYLAVCWSNSGSGAEFPGQIPLLPLPGRRTGRRPFAQWGGEAGEPGGAAGHSAPPVTDWTWCSHEDDSEETVGLLQPCLINSISRGWCSTYLPICYFIFQPVWKDSRWSRNHLWGAAPHKGFISSDHYCEWIWDVFTGLWNCFLSPVVVKIVIGSSDALVPLQSAQKQRCKEVQRWKHTLAWTLCLILIIFNNRIKKEKQKDGLHTHICIPIIISWMDDDCDMNRCLI